LPTRGSSCSPAGDGSASTLRAPRLASRERQRRAVAQADFLVLVDFENGALVRIARRRPIHLVESELAFRQDDPDRSAVVQKADVEAPVVVAEIFGGIGRRARELLRAARTERPEVDAAAACEGS